MIFTTEIEINKPIVEVVAKFDDPDNLSKWMEGLQSFEHLSGTPGQPGAKSRLKFKMGKREIEMMKQFLCEIFLMNFQEHMKQKEFIIL